VTDLSKQSLREKALALRLMVSPEERARAGRALAERFLHHVELPPLAVIAGYWPVRGEIDVLPLLHALIIKGYRCCLPHVVGFKQPLLFREWHEDARMTEGPFGIHQPDPEFHDAVLPSVVIAPLLAFDLSGQRLGYGSGFYDRTFGKFHETGHKFIAVGAAFERQRLEELPAGPYDYAMDLIVTEETIHRTGARA
jgi:5-formyltetrahydrofolate cyclo-ligase